MFQKAKTTNRLTALLLAFVMLLSLIPAMSLTAFAGTPTAPTVTISPNENAGTVNKESLYDGMSWRLTAIPADGYTFKEWNWTKDGSPIVNKSNPTDLSAEVINSQSVTNITAVFEAASAVTFAITDASVNGTVTASVNGTVVTEAEADDTVLLTVAPANGYQFKSITAELPKDSPENFSDLVDLMGTAVFDGTEDDWVSFGGYTCKVVNGGFEVSYGTTKITEAASSDVTGFSIPSPTVYCFSCGNIGWNFVVNEGKIIFISIYDNSNWTELFEGGGTSNGALSPAKINLTTVTEGSEYTFTMPKKSVNVKAEFEEIPVTNYPLWVGDTQVTSENLSGTGWSFAPADGTTPATLTLSGVTVSTRSGSFPDSYGILWDDTAALNIVLTADTVNTVSPMSANYGIYSKGAVTISGTGTLTAAGSGGSGAKGIYTKGLTISGGTVNFNGTNGIYCPGSTVTITGGTLTATGDFGAINGTVINSIAGIGWTNKAGTEGQAAIATSTTGQNLSTYKKVYFTPHTHDFTYSASGATITATCTDGCPAGYDNANKPTLTIVAPERNVYGGTGSEKATLDGLDAFNNATGKSITATNIKYYNATKDGTTYTKTGDALAAAPTNAGDYVAEIMLPVSTAKIAGTPIRVGYTIAKANITPTVSLKGWTYGTVANTPVVSGNTENGAVTYTYAVYGSDSFSATVPTDAGEYTVKATIAATANYNGGEATDDFKIYKADINPTVTLEGWAYGDTPNTPVVTGNLGNGEVTFGYAKQGIKGSLYSETVPTEVGNYVVLATIAGTANYNGGEATADFTIAKADATSATVTANKLTCDGKEQALVTVTGEAKGGEMQYALGKDAETAPEDGWSTDIPAATNTGTYYVWYKVVADDNHNAFKPSCVEVTIDPDYTVKEVTGLSGNGEDEWTKGGEEGVVITVKDSGEDNSFDHFTGVKLDGKLLTKDVDYTVTKGSTIVTLLTATLEKLSVGEHTVTILFDNGEVNTDLTVKAANSVNPTSPQTGDNSHMGLWIAIMILSLCVLAATLFIGKKKKAN